MCYVLYPVLSNFYFYLFVYHMSLFVNKLAPMDSLSLFECLIVSGPWSRFAEYSHCNPSRLPSSLKGIYTYRHIFLDKYFFFWAP